MSDAQKNEAQWPAAAASRIRVRCIDDKGAVGQQCCRLFYNESNQAIELVPTTDDFDVVSREVYDDVNTGIANEPTYKSYLVSNQDADRRIIDSFQLNNVIGANLCLQCNTKNPNTFHGMQRYSSSASINIYAYPKMKKGKICNEGKRSANHKNYAIDSRGCEDFGDARKLIEAIRNLAGLQSNLPINNNPIRYLVILNPFSGGNDGCGVSSKTGAKYIYESLLNPMLEEAGVEHDLLVTGWGGHAQERMKDRRSHRYKTAPDGSSDAVQRDDNLCSINTDTETNDISEYKAIIAMGGDGILFEIMQGIHTREDESEIFKNMKFGIVGCGTSNGLAKSILHWSGVSPFCLDSML
jgi:sphingosine kinase